jgi:molybdenum cofactor cytidylyltransferase
VAQANGATVHAARVKRSSDLATQRHELDRLYKISQDNQVKSWKACSAIILAAGRSSRMGAFKPLLPFGNKTVIECCIDYLRDGGINDVVVVLGHRADEIRQKISDVSFAVNPDSDSPMGASIAVGVSALPKTAQAILIALVDHPAIPASVVSTLLESWKTGARLVIPTWNDRGGHPVLVDLSFRAELLNLSKSGGLRAFLQAHASEVTRIPVDSPFIARDMDTWDDYTALHMEATGRSAPNLPPA